MKKLRKRKIAKSLGIKVRFCKCLDGSTYIFMRGNMGGESIFLEKNEVMSDKLYLETLKKTHQFHTF